MMESMSGGFVRILSESEEKIDIGQKINVLDDIMQDEAFEAALEFQINDDEKDDVSKYKILFKKKKKMLDLRFDYRGLIIYFIEGRSPSRPKCRFCI